VEKENLKMMTVLERWTPASDLFLQFCHVICI